MRLLVLNGSPRRGGNTDLLVAEFVKGTESAGAETKVIVLSDLTIAPCQHCDFCLKAGRCRIQDDMQMIYDELEKLDRLVIVSPIHFMSVTAQMKAAIDRCQVYWAKKYRLKVPPLADKKERKGFFISVGARNIDRVRLFGPAIETVKSLFFSLDVKYAGELFFPGVDEMGAIKNIPGALAEAYESGKKFVTD